MNYCAEVAFTVELKSVAPIAITAKKAVLAWSAIPIKRAKVSKYFQKRISCKQHLGPFLNEKMLR